VRSLKKVFQSSAWDCAAGLSVCDRTGLAVVVAWRCCCGAFRSAFLVVNDKLYVLLDRACDSLTEAAGDLEMAVANDRDVTADVVCWQASRKPTWVGTAVSMARN
jgi:hypothetical protein